MEDNKTHQIVCLCLEIDKIADKAYSELADISRKKDFKKFWRRMSVEEQIHIDFWERICALPVKPSTLPNIFDDPKLVCDELNRIIPKAKNLLSRCKDVSSVSDAFVLAYRLEFYLLHPAFETLFHVLRHLVGDPCPEDDYEKHINSFVQMLANHGKVSPELELLGETLQRLWKENRALAERAAHDPLTGLLTRQAFAEIALHLSHLARRQTSTVGIMMLDLDKFKRINDKFGHQAGDRVLKAVSEIVRSNIRAADLACRYGGEEILILMSDTKAETAYVVAERIRRAVESAKPEGIEVSLSIGLVTGIMSEDPEGELYNFINQADACLYDAKKEGRNRVVTKLKKIEL